MNLSKPMPGEPRNLQADGVRSDINGGKGRHGGRATVYRAEMEWPEENVNVRKAELLAGCFEGIQYLHAERGEILFVPRCHCQVVNSGGCSNHYVFEQIVWPSTH